mmetsp:Transcript_6627/g.15707  ORF Transcript_6627/g.15707 Transcript_6627/m.15707 type:complete len:286 (+) Transcript_6627:652-1509(+)
MSWETAHQTTSSSSLSSSDTNSSATPELARAARTSCLSPRSSAETYRRLRPAVLTACKAKSRLSRKPSANRIASAQEAIPCRATSSSPWKRGACSRATPWSCTASKTKARSSRRDAPANAMAAGFCRTDDNTNSRSSRSCADANRKARPSFASAMATKSRSAFKCSGTNSKASGFARTASVAKPVSQRSSAAAKARLRPSPVTAAKTKLRSDRNCSGSSRRAKGLARKICSTKLPSLSRLWSTYLMAQLLDATAARTTSGSLWYLPCAKPRRSPYSRTVSSTTSR